MFMNHYVFQTHPHSYIYNAMIAEMAILENTSHYPMSFYSPYSCWYAEHNVLNRQTSQNAGHVTENRETGESQTIVGVLRIRYVAWHMWLLASSLVCMQNEMNTFDDHGQVCCVAVVNSFGQLDDTRYNHMTNPAWLATAQGKWSLFVEDELSRWDPHWSIQNPPNTIYGFGYFL